MTIKLKDLPEKYNIKPDPNGSTRCKTPVFEANYVAAFEPKETPSGDMKYGMAMLWPKDKASDLKAIVQSICNAAAKKFGVDHTKWANGLRCPLRDGDESDNDGYQGNLFMNTGSKDKPGIVDRTLDPIMDKSEFYSGCEARASLSFYGYDQAGNKGVGCGLNNILKWADGDRKDGKSTAESDFAEYKDETAVKTASDSSDFEDDIPF